MLRCYDIYTICNLSDFGQHIIGTFLSYILRLLQVLSRIHIATQLTCMYTCYVMLCYMDICIAPLADGIQRRSQRGRLVKRKVFKLLRDADDIPCIASHSEVQEEYHSKVQDPQLQMPGSGIEKYGIKVQEDHSDQQSAADERSEQIFV